MKNMKIVDRLISVAAVLVGLFVLSVVVYVLIDSASTP